MRQAASWHHRHHHHLPRQPITLILQSPAYTARLAFWLDVPHTSLPTVPPCPSYVARLFESSKSAFHFCPLPPSLIPPSFSPWLLPRDQSHPPASTPPRLRMSSFKNTRASRSPHARRTPLPCSPLPTPCCVPLPTHLPSCKIPGRSSPCPTREQWSTSLGRSRQPTSTTTSLMGLGQT